MSKKTNKNIINYRKPVHVNIGVVVFAFVLIYFLIYIIGFITNKHISIYEVQKGQIMKTSYYTGLVLRSEEVMYANESGNINYYKKERDKAGYNDLICSIDKKGSISNEITAAGLDGTTMTKAELLEIQNIITEYTNEKNNMQFYKVYSFKDNLNSNVQENLYLAALNTLSDKTSAAESQNTFSFVRASIDGALAFYTDGYEDVTPDTFSADMFNPSAYVKSNLKSNSQVNSGQALYKTITNENWYMLVPISDSEREEYQKQISEGSDSFIIYVTFKKDDCTTYATATLKEYDGKDFLQLAFNSSMIRYISDRYLEIELGNDDNMGLKIPNSSIISKEFLIIPNEYISKGDNSSAKGVIKISKDKLGRESVEFVETDVYYTDPETNLSYIEADDLALDDIIQMPESTEQYVIRDIGDKQGVFNMNKGYAVFKIIDPIATNEEYTIIKTGTRYGLSLYDRIALDGTSVYEGEFAN